MHLQDLVFRIVAINGRRVKGALRDTVYEPLMTMVEVALDAGEDARWLLQHHHMAHMATNFSVAAST